MDSSQNKARSMDGIETPHLLPVTLPKKTDAVRRVSAWALFNASIYGISFGVASALDDHPRARSSQPPFFLRCCVALQAAAAVLALCLPCRRRSVRRALAYLALALTIASHCIYAATGGLSLVSDPRGLFFGICFAESIVFLAAVDIIGILELVREVGGEE